MAKRILRPRKLLVASTGVATLSYLAAGCDTRATASSVANLMAPQSTEPMSVVANLPAPPVLTLPDGSPSSAPPATTTEVPPTLPSAGPLDAGALRDASAGSDLDAARDASSRPDAPSVRDASLGSDAASGDTASREDAAPRADSGGLARDGAIGEARDR